MDVKQGHEVRALGLSQAGSRIHRYSTGLHAPAWRYSNPVEEKPRVNLLILAWDPGSVLILGAERVSPRSPRWPFTRYLGPRQVAQATIGFRGAVRFHRLDQCVLIKPLMSSILPRPVSDLESPANGIARYQPFGYLKYCAPRKPAAVKPMDGWPLPPARNFKTFITPFWSLVIQSCLVPSPAISHPPSSSHFVHTFQRLSPLPCLHSLPVASGRPSSTGPTPAWAMALSTPTARSSV